MAVVVLLVQVFVWEDRDDDVVDSYKTLEGHRSDILAMAAYAPRQLLATGENKPVAMKHGVRCQLPGGKGQQPLVM